MKIGFAETTDFMFEALTDPPVFDDGAFHAKFSPDIGVSVLRLHKFRQRSVPPAESGEEEVAGDGGIQVRHSTSWIAHRLPGSINAAGAIGLGRNPARESNIRPTPAWHHENRASDSVGLPGFAQHLLYLPYALIVAGEFGHSRRSPMRDVDIGQAIQQFALNPLRGFA
jgi:hypothetical protein